jgi:heterotetrameric sarcosine oxidase gamma subunit
MEGGCVAELIAKAPLAGQAQLALAETVLAPLEMQEIWSVALFPGQAKAAGKVLKPLGLAFPAPGTFTTGKAGARLVWTGREQAFLMGAAAPDGLVGLAAVTDQSDAWVGFALSGAGAEAVLARLVPVDLRLAAFPAGRAIRAPLNHMASVILRNAEGFEIYAFRSMARTAWHELAEALQHLAARGTQAV